MNRSLVAFVGFAAIGAFVLSTEHRAHLFGALPFAFLLACPLLHVFMHGGHRDHGSHRPEVSEPGRESKTTHEHGGSPS